MAPGARRALFAAVTGTLIEWYDYALYGAAAGLVIAPLFFESATAGATLAAFATFAVGFLARPLGGVMVGHLGDRYGRRPALLLTIVVMGAATVGIGLLPTAAAIGVLAPVLLVVLRLLQGMGAGAELAGATTLVAEFAPSHRRGLLTSLVLSMPPAGIALATGTFLWASTAGDEALLEWAWRLPFLASAVLFALAVFIRRRLEETPEYVQAQERAAEHGERDRVPVVELFRRHRRAVLLGFLSVTGHNALNYTMAVYALSLMTSAEVGLDRAAALTAVTVGSLAGVVATPFGGLAADRFGPRIVLAAGSGLGAAVRLPPAGGAVERGRGPGVSGDRARLYRRHRVHLGGPGRLPGQPVPTAGTLQRDRGGARGQRRARGRHHSARAHLARDLRRRTLGGRGLRGAVLPAVGRGRLPGPERREALIVVVRTRPLTPPRPDPKGRSMSGLKRRLPQPSELLPLMKFGAPGLGRRAHRLRGAADIADLRSIARRRTPRAAFDYVDGAAGAELTARRTREAFDSTELLPRILHGTAEADLSTTIAGGPSALPFGIAPTGFTRFMHAEGEDAGSAAAAQAGIPFTLSTMGTRSVEQVAQAAPGGRRWFQLYLWRDREGSRELLDRAWAGGYDTLLVTVDTPVAGQRLRDVRNGMTIPPRLSARTILDASYRPEWWFNFLSTDPLTFASLSGTTHDLPTLINSMFDPTLSVADLEWARENCREALRQGRADRPGHPPRPGRRRGRTGRLQPRRPPARPCPGVPEGPGGGAREAGAEAEIILDSGILSGADIVSALALGADFTLIGRAYLYGLMAGGREGVTRAIELLAAEVRTAVQLMGCATIADVQRSGQVRAPWL